LSPKSRRTQASQNYVKDQSACPSARGHVTALPQQEGGGLCMPPHVDAHLQAATPRQRRFSHDASAYISGLERTAVEQCVNEHVTALQQHPDVHYSVPERYQAAEALASLGADAQLARAALETALVTDTSVHVRKSIARALGELGDKRAQPVLQQVLQNDPDKFVRMRASESLDVLNGVTVTSV